MTDRRQFLRFLAGNPLFAAVGLDRRFLEDLASSSPRRVSRAMALVQEATQGTPPIRSAAQALDVFDFEPVARTKMSVAHWAYLATGTDDDGTIRVKGLITGRSNLAGWSTWNP